MLSIPEVIVPPYPGITSAMGLLTTDLKYDAIRTQFQVSSKIDLKRLNADLAEMERRLAAQFAADHLDADGVRFVRDGDLRYVGQGYELKIPFPEGDRRRAIWGRSGSFSIGRINANTAIFLRRTQSRSSTSA